MSGSRILSLSARNIKRIKEVAIDEVGDIHEVRGDADQGKTSILDAIEGALSGLDKSMVRRGADSAELELCLSDAKVKRIINAGDGKDTLMVTDNNGKAVDRAKDFLKTIWGPATFRPLSWVQLGGGENKGKTERRRLQRDQLLEALDVSLSGAKVADFIERELGEDYVQALDEVNLDQVDFEQHPFIVCRAFEQAVYDFRKMKGNEADKAEEVLRNTPAPDMAAPKASAAKCREMEEQAIQAYHQAAAQARGMESLKQRRERLAEAVAEDGEDLPDEKKLAKTREHYASEAERLDGEIERLQAALEKARDERREAQVSLDKCDTMQRQIERHAANVDALAEVEGQLGEEYDQGAIDALKEKMEQAQERRKARELQDQHDAAAEEASAARAVVEQFNSLVAVFRDDLPKQLLAEADLPVDGLSIDDETILIDGVPLHQLGTSRQIRLGVLIAHALNPRSAFVLVDGAESMGKADRKALADVAGELGLQLIMTFVDADAEPSEGVTVMRDGSAV